jgi:ribosomal protein L12E/L44/L45/RPP1/RPP2
MHQDEDDCGSAAACSFCCEEFATVTQAQACERAHTAAAFTGSDQEEEEQQQEEEEEAGEGEEDEDL